MGGRPFVASFWHCNMLTEPPGKYCCTMDKVAAPWTRRKGGRPCCCFYPTATGALVLRFEVEGLHDWQTTSQVVDALLSGGEADAGSRPPPAAGEPFWSTSSLRHTPNVLCTASPVTWAQWGMSAHVVQAARCTLSSVQGELCVPEPCADMTVLLDRQSTANQQPTEEW